MTACQRACRARPAIPRRRRRVQSIRNKRPSRRARWRAGKRAHHRFQFLQRTRDAAPPRHRRVGAGTHGVKSSDVRPEGLLLASSSKATPSPSRRARARSGRRRPRCRRRAWRAASRCCPRVAPAAGFSRSMAAGCSGACARCRLRAAMAAAADVERQQEAALHLGHRRQLEIDHRDRRQRSEGPDHQLGHVQPGDVLHHHAAGLHQLAFEGGERACRSTRSRAVPYSRRRGPLDWRR